MEVGKGALAEELAELVRLLETFARAAENLAAGDPCRVASVGRFVDRAGDLVVGWLAVDGLIAEAAPKAKKKRRAVARRKET